MRKRGTAFGVRGVVTPAGSPETVLWESDTLPFGFDGEACARARSHANDAPDLRIVGY